MVFTLGSLACGKHLIQALPPVFTLTGRVDKKFHLVSVTSHTPSSKHDENRKWSFNTVCKQPLYSFNEGVFSVAQSPFAHVGVRQTYCDGVLYC